MAADKTIKKRRNKRKSRTEVSSPISSDNETSPSSTPEPEENPIPAEKPSKKQKVSKTTPSAPISSIAEDEISLPPIQESSKSSQVHEKAFSDFVLRQTTNEFANDLDELRKAGDFNARSVGMLVRALRQGTECFAVEERMRVGRAVEG